MAYDAATTGLLEEALSEGFQYHRELDNFLLRSGLSKEALHEARARADARLAHSNRGFTQAPKRFVAQEALAILSESGSRSDEILASLVTGFSAGQFPNASPAGKTAISSLSAKMRQDRSDRRADQKAKADDQAHKQAAARRAKEAELLAIRRKREALRDRFLGLMSEGNAQTRGYSLEAFLNDFFELEGLDPRSSFKIEGEQIDGSFVWRQRSNLVECKWTKNAAAGAEFGAFQFKIEGKSADTRGLFLSINGYSSHAITALNGKGALKFICLDGTHLMRALDGGEPLPEMLSKAWRHADETGEAYLHVSKL